MNPDRMTAKEYREMAAKIASRASGGSWRGAVAKPTTEGGIRFPSKVQAAVYRMLLRYQDSSGLIVIREPIIDVRALAVGDKPGRWRPDFLVARIPTGSGGTRVEIHEAKGSKSSESRDWRLRAVAAKNEYPWIPIYVWRLVNGTPVQQSLEDALR